MYKFIIRIFKILIFIYIFDIIRYSLRDNE